MKSSWNNLKKSTDAQVCLHFYDFKAGGEKRADFKRVGTVGGSKPEGRGSPGVGPRAAEQPGRHGWQPGKSRA